MVGFFKKLFQREPPGLRPYETQCVAWFSEQLPEEARAILTAQIEAHKEFGRSDDGRIVYIPSPPRKSQVPLFPNRSIDLCVARLMVKDDAGGLMKCDFVFHSGEPLRIVFGAPPQQRLSGEISLSEAEIYHDLMTPGDWERRPPSSPVQFPDKLKGLPIGDLAPPPSEEVIAKFARRFSPSLPADYVELLKLSEGFTLNGWEVNGLRTWDADYDEGIFSYLAEGEDLEEQDACGLAVREGDTSPKMWLHNKIAHSFTELGDSFIDALIQVAVGPNAGGKGDPDQPDSSWPTAPKTGNR